MIDKPLVGSERDCRRVRELASQGAVILGSSSARYAYEIQELNRLPVEERGELVSVLGTVGVDEFNYGIHIAEAIGRLLGTDAQWVRYLGRGEAGGKYSESYYVQYAGGQSAVYNTFTGTWQPFVLSVMTTKRTYVLQLDSNRLYEALMKQVADYMEEKANLLVDTQALVESVEIMLAGLASRETGGKIVRLDELREDGPAYNGKQFRKGYAAVSGQMYAL